MAIIAPFRGILYNPQKINRLAEVVTPPYDVIDPKGQEEYYQHHPYNIVRLDFGKILPDDSPEENRYTRAAQMLQVWKRDQILIQDQNPAIYLYKIHFPLSAQKVNVRTGLIALLGLEPFDSGKVRPHEKTFSSFKRDRYQIFQHCQMQFCPIFSFYLDPENRIISNLENKTPPEPFIDFVDQDSIRHQLWRVKDPSILKNIQKNFLEKTVYIADGHHRYETSLAYQADTLREHPELDRSSAINYTLMFFCPMEDPGLTIFPVHRILHRHIEMGSNQLENRLKLFFYLDKIPLEAKNKPKALQAFLSRLESKGKQNPAFGLVYPHASQVFLLSLKEEHHNGDWAEGLDPLMRQLDVVILSRLVFQQVLGLRTEELDLEETIEYRHDIGEVLEALEKGKGEMGFILNPTPIEQIRQIAEASQVMPRKSTYFYPKTLTGLVMNSLKWDESIGI